MDKIVERYRSEAIARVFGTSKFKQCWPIWRKEIAARTSDFSDSNAIYELGSSLREIFGLTAKESGASERRGQGELSGGGAAWEGLVCWYLNTVLTQTNAVVVKHSKVFIPKSLLDAVSINYQNKATNSESDLFGIVFPSGLDGSISDYSVKNIDSFIEKKLGKTEVHIIQCKTNWNDSAQNPMLWDLVYKSKGFKENNLSIGQNGRDFEDLKNFSYSFVTVPSQKTAFKIDSMAVRRVSSLSGGNFWESPRSLAWP